MIGGKGARVGTWRDGGRESTSALLRSGVAGPRLLPEWARITGIVRALAVAVMRSADLSRR